MSTDRIILFYDGTCGFCHKVVQLSIQQLRNDAEVFFSPLQGETATKYRLKIGSFPISDDAIVLVDDGNVFIGAEAFYKLAKYFMFPLSLFWFFSFLPHFISNFAYNIVAENRYKLFGRKDHCLIPDTEFKNRFLS